MGKLLDWPPVWLGACIVMVWAMGQVWPMPLFGPYGDWMGWPLVVLGFALMGLAAWEMMRARTTLIPRQKPSRLVTSGVFRHSRNPIYLGDALILLGSCLIFDVVLGLLLIPVFIWIINRRFIIPEEAVLTREFGNDYTNWCAAVRRWV